MWISRPALFSLKVIHQASRIAGALGVASMVAMMLLTTTDVFLRYFLNKPIMGSMELTEYLMVATAFLVFAWCAVNKGHVSVDLIVSFFPPKYQAVIDSITYLLALTVIPFVAWYNFIHAHYVMVEKDASDLLEVPAYPLYLIIGITFTILFLVVICLLVESIGKALKR